MAIWLAAIGPTYVDVSDENYVIVYGACAPSSLN
jgi:hypothetical protein